MRRLIAALKHVFIFISVVFFLLTMGSLAISAISQKHDRQEEMIASLGLFTDALDFIQDQYVQEVRPKDLIYGALTGMLADLDPHSQFLLPEEFDELKIDTEGKFGGIGVEITMKDDLVTVITAIEDSPAWAAGLAPNDRIVKIDEEVIKNFTLNDAVKRLRGKPNTVANIVIWREKEGKLYSFKIKRMMIDVKDIKEARIIDDHIGYLRIVEFREGTPQELDRVLKNLKAQGLKGLVIDLRNNPGGLLERAIETTQRFLAPGSLIVTVRGRNPKQAEEFKSSLHASDVTTPIVLLLNEGSASGSEIMAGALQDHKRAVLLGTKTFGKGSVQTVLPLRDGSALKLTTSHYYTPSGRSIHEQGIEPDIEMADAPVGEAVVEAPGDIDKIFENVDHSIPEEPAVAKKESAPKNFTDDPPLAKAVDLLKNVDVFRGRQADIERIYETEGSV